VRRSRSGPNSSLPAIVATPIVHQGRGLPGPLLQPFLGNVRKTAAVEFHAHSSAASPRCLLNPAVFPVPPRPGETFRHILPVDQHRVIGGKKTLIVLQHPQAKPGNLRVRGVDVDDIKPAPASAQHRQPVLQPRTAKPSS